MLEFKEKITNELKQLWQADKKIHTFWEGGSVATGFDDDYSDLDAALICDDDYVEEVFTKTEKLLDESYGISEKFRVPEPCWHGHSQSFYLLNDSPKFFYIDLFVQKVSAGNRLMESNRHGSSYVWFDKKDLMDSTSMPEKEYRNKIVQKLRLFRDSFFINKIELEKQIVREREVDAMDGYIKMIIGRLAFLFNVKNRPAKHDFGLLYSYREWSQGDHEFVKEMLYVKDLNDLRKKSQIVINKVEELTTELLKKWAE